MAQVCRALEKRKPVEIPFTFDRPSPRQGKILMQGELALVLGHTLCSLNPRFLKKDRLPFREKGSFQLESFTSSVRKIKKGLRQRLTILRAYLETLELLLHTRAEVIFEEKRPYDEERGVVVLVFPEELLPSAVVNLALYTARNHVPVRRLDLKYYHTSCLAHVTKLPIPFQDSRFCAQEDIPFRSWSVQHYPVHYFRRALLQTPLSPRVVPRTPEEPQVDVTFEVFSDRLAHPLLQAVDLRIEEIATEGDAEEPEPEAFCFSDLRRAFEEEKRRERRNTTPTLQASYSDMVLAPSIEVDDVSLKPRLRAEIREMTFAEHGVTGLPVARNEAKGYPVLDLDLLRSNEAAAQKFLQESCPQLCFDDWDAVLRGENLPACNACEACMRRCRDEIFHPGTPQAFRNLVVRVEKLAKRKIVLESNERHSAGSSGYEEAYNLYLAGARKARTTVEDYLKLLNDW
jgi:hypothetical protein